jgi:uncharacterized membrane protein
METDYRDKQKKSYNLMRMTYDLTMAILMLGVAVVMLLAEKIKVMQLLEVDSMFRYFFGTICLLYGSFRLYRGIKREY